MSQGRLVSNRGVSDFGFTVSIGLLVGGNHRSVSGPADPMSNHRPKAPAWMGSLFYL